MNSLNTSVRRTKTCREEVLETAKVIVKEKQLNEFSVNEIIKRMNARGTTFLESTIRTHICSKCCVNSPKHHAVTYSDYERVKPGIYKMVNV